jgi:type IV pilus assembly protein PilV
MSRLPVLPRHLPQRGFSLLEVLISVLILAVGLISLSSLYVAGTQNNKNAALRTLATQQAYDMADRMRANMTGLIAAPSAYHRPTATENTNCRAAAGCTAAQMAQHDMYEWNNSASAVSNAAVLPGGMGVVCLDSTPNDGTYNGTSITNDGCDGLGTMYAIKIWWRDDRQEATPTYSCAAGTARRNCFVTTLQPQL